MEHLKKVMKSKRAAIWAKRVIPLIMILIAGSVSAQNYYVLMKDTDYLYNNDGSLGVKSSFDESCLWVASGTLGTTTRTIYSYIDDTKFLKGSASNNANVTLGTTSNVWRLYNTYLCTRSGNNTYYYFYNNGTTYATSNSTTTATTARRFVAYEVTISTVAQQGSLPSISPSTATIDLDGTQSFSVPNTVSYTPAYTKYSWSSTNYYRIAGQTTYSTTQPTAQSGTFSSAIWSLSSTTYATTQTSGRTVTVTRNNQRAAENQTITLTTNATYSNGGTNYSYPLSATITIPYTLADPTSIAFASTAVDMLSTDVVSLPATFVANGRPDLNHITVESSNPNVATAAFNSTTLNLDITGVGAGTTTLSIKVNGVEMASATVNVTGVCAAPVITIDNNGLVAITTATPLAANATIYYTLDGSTPTAASTPYTTPFSVSNMITVRAIAIPSAAGYVASPVADQQFVVPTGVANGIVTLNDYEDHNWTYYQTEANGGVPGLNSPDPRNVKITYKARTTGVTWAQSAAVSISEPEHTFVYYKTLEKVGTNYSYEVIPNPFSKRPKDGTQWKGFGGWKVVSVTGGTISGYAVNSIIPAETTINFVPTSTYTTNCTSMEVVLEANWVNANRYTSASSVPNSGTYETNFLVLTASATSIPTPSGPSTIMMVEPDGSQDYRSGKSISGSFTAAANTKFEYININNTGTGNTFTANNHDLILGRGINNTTGNSSINLIQGLGAASNSTQNYAIRIESGKYANVSFTKGTNTTGTGDSYGANNNYVKGTLGCDYDRSTSNNDLMIVSNEICCGAGAKFCNSNANAHKMFDCVMKSGTLSHAVGSADAGSSFYIGIMDNYNWGYRTLTVEGGVLANIAGGMDSLRRTDNTAVLIRIKGGTVNGAVYGAAAWAQGGSNRRFIFTGGLIKGWVASGCNGTQSNGGDMKGDSYIYIGGNCRVDGDNLINFSNGGNVFGAGSGRSGGNNDQEVGRVNNSTVAIADNAFVRNDVYGGGNYAKTINTGRIYIKGGTVGGKVFGGSNRNLGTNTIIRMDGGTVVGGIYGGSNVDGTIGGNTDIEVTGGTVGVIGTSAAHVCGGGYGSATRVTNNVDVTIGGTATVYGEVYGGSEQGLVNTNANSDSYQSGKHTLVNVEGNCTINGAVYGGGLGTTANAANTYGVSKVTMTGGTVNGNVFGCNNFNGKPFDLTVEVEMTGGTATNVYGGGNEAGYTGNPSVTISGTSRVTNNVYGGGKGVGAKVTGNTNVLIKSDAVIDNNVYGGGHGAEVQGNTNVTIGE